MPAPAHDLDALVSLSRELLELQRQTYVKAQAAFVLAASAATALELAGGTRMQAEFRRQVSIQTATASPFDDEVRALLVKTIGFVNGSAGLS